MARKRVQVIYPDRPPEHITHREAFNLVRDEQAEWEEKYRRIRLVDRRVAPRGMNRSNFDDVWNIQPSGGVIPVWQVRRDALRGL